MDKEHNFHQQKSFVKLAQELSEATHSSSMHDFESAELISIIKRPQFHPEYDLVFQIEL